MIQDIVLSPDQADALDAILDFWQKERRTLRMGGFAGTGKSTVIREATRALRGKSRRKWRHKDARIAFCAYTGKAAEVVRRKLVSGGALEGDDYCGTIHGLIYSPVFLDGKLVRFDRNERLDYDLIVVDEASMVDEDTKADLESFRVPVLYVGDHGQLPPVQGTLNLMADPDIRLEKIHRQAEDNPIIRLSMMARTEGRIPVGVYGEYVRKVDDLNVLQRIADPDKALILCGWNKFRCETNRKVRGMLGIVEPGPVVGDRVVCLRNNRDRGVFNGMTGTIRELEQDTRSVLNASIDMDGSGTYTGRISLPQFGEDKTLLKVPGWSLESPVDLFDWGYCLTVHKAQGSEHDRVVLFEQRFSMMDDEAWRRWLYTGVTRARERLLLVGF